LTVTVTDAWGNGATVTTDQLAQAFSSDPTGLVTGGDWTVATDDYGRPTGRYTTSLEGPTAGDYVVQVALPGVPETTATLTLIPSGQPTPTPSSTPTPSPTPTSTPTTSDHVQLSNTGWQIGDKKAKLKVTVTATSNWTASSDASWLKVKSASGRSGQTFKLVAAKNKGGDREGHITVRSGGASTTLTVHQTGASTVHLTATPALWQPGSAASTQTFTVTTTTTGATFPWTVKSKDKWVHVVQQSGDQLTLSVDTNAKHSDRKGKVVIQSGSQSLTINVRQAGNG
jgi:hypothetical protein